MAYRIEVVTHVNDTRSEVMRKNLVSEGFAIETAKVLEVYTVNKNFNSEEIKKIAEILSNPISQKFKIVTKTQIEKFDDSSPQGRYLNRSIKIRLLK